MAGRRQAVRGTSKRRSTVSRLSGLVSLLKTVYLFYGVLAVVLLSAGFKSYQYLQEQDVLPIETVEIEGEFHYLFPEDLKQQVLPEVQGGFFSVRLELIRDALMQVPWVEDVSIHRQWPQALRIRVIEKQPVAFWGEQGFISSRGVLFKPENINKELALPVLAGLEGQHGVMLKQLGKVQLLLSDLDMYVVKMKQDNRRSWTLLLSPGFELRLGRDDMYERLQKFVDIYKPHLKAREQNIKHVDMRYTNGFAVAYKEQSMQGRGA